MLRNGTTAADGFKELDKNGGEKKKKKFVATFPH